MEPIMAYKINQPFKVSLDGLSVIEIPKGEYKELPEIAVDHGNAIKAVEGKGKAVANKDWELSAKKEAE
jgi:hypothetical protein